MDFITRFVSLFMAVIFSMSAITAAGRSNKWQLDDFPEYKGGIKSDSLYDAGSGREPDWKDFSEENNNYAQFVSKTGISEFEKYLKKLENSGFIKIFENHIKYNQFYCYANGDKQLYISYNSRNGEARFMDNSCSDRIDQFGYKSVGDKQSSFWQFNLNYYDDRVVTDKERNANNGMLYAIRLSDNSLVVIDGGAIAQSSNANAAALNDFLHDITDTPAGEKVRIAMWYGTHGHSDHITLFSKLLLLYSSQYTIERLAYNYQSYSNVEYDHRVDWFREQTNRLYPDAKYLKVRSGMSWDISDAHFQVLCTHEDVADIKTAKIEAVDANDCTSVVKITLGGVKFLITGDTDELLMNTLLNKYESNSLKSDVIQGAHHMLNADVKLYETVKAKYLFAPQSSYRVIDKNYRSYQTALNNGVSKDNVFFASLGSYGLVPVNGKVTVQFKDPVCTPYDFSGIDYDFPM